MKRIKTLFLFFNLLAKNRFKTIIYLILTSIFTTICSIFLLFLPTLLIQLILNKISFNFLFLLFIIFGICNFIKQFIQVKVDTEKEILDQIFVMLITNKMNKIPYYYLELENIKQQKESSIYAILNYGAVYDLYFNLLDIFNAMFMLISIIITSIYYSLWYMLIVFALSVCIVAINYLLLKIKFKYSKQTISLNYKFNYYQEIATLRKYQINHKLYKYSQYVKRDFNQLNNLTTKHFHKIRLAEFKYNAFVSIVDGFNKIMIYGIPIYYWGLKLIAIDIVSLWLNLGMNFSNYLLKMLTAIGNIFQSLDYLIPFWELMNIQEVVDNNKQTSKETFKSLEFKNVSFKYPNYDHMILKNVNFKIKQNQKVALLGPNGSGKTTLIKLLLRLYDLNDGEILIDHQNIKNNLFNHNGVVFQDPKIFPITLKENLISDTINVLDFNQIINKVGFDQIMLSKKIDYAGLCNSEVYDDGIEFSGGEKQLLALCRAMIRNADLVILDEPSSALDPIMKNKLLKLFNQLFFDKTVILITHDPLLANKCDRKILLNDGICCFE